MSMPSDTDISNARDTQALESKPINGENSGSKYVGPPENTHPQYDEYTTLLKKHLSVVESELSILKGLNNTGSKVGERGTKAQEAKIHRVPQWQWREVKTKNGIISEQPILIVSSNGQGKVGRRSTGRGSIRQKSMPDNKFNNDESSFGEGSSLGTSYRLTINSKLLLNLLGDCTGMVFPEDRNVWLRPFKYLVAYEAEIRQALQDAEENLHRMEVEPGPSDQTDTTQTHHEGSVTCTKPAQEAGKVRTGAAEFESHVTGASSAKAERDQLRCLVSFMDTDMQDILDVKRQVANRTLKEVAFEHLWLLYKPGDLVYSAKSPEDISTYQAYRVLHVTGGRPILDTANKSNFHAVWDREWDEESETEERARDTIRSSGPSVTPFIIDCFSIDFDGDRLGPKSRRVVIPKYNGNRKVNAFEIYPWGFHPQQEKVSRALAERGRRFTQLAAGAHHRYSGTTLRESRDLWQPQMPFQGSLNYVIHDEEVLGPLIALLLSGVYLCSSANMTPKVHSEVMLDQAAGVTHYRKAIEKWRLKLNGGVIAVPTLANSREIFDPLPVKQGQDPSTDVFDDNIIDLNRRDEFVNSTTLLEYRDILEPSLSGSDDYIMLLPFRVYGYAILNRKWFPLNINLVSDITPDQMQTTSSGYDDLVLPPGHKKLLQAIVKNQVRDPKQTSDEREEESDEFQMDIVKGKGEGLIILLHGAPGVGKTSTAECVAAQLKRPLLSITCGDLSTDVKQAEEKLLEYCTLAHRWRCVLLLDEADVFLAKREKSDITRNALVSVFLRVLEYFSGVIILTTNRVGAFDEAFRSRIHVSLYYPKLDKPTTIQIWERSLSRLRKSSLKLDFSEDEILRFAQGHWLENEKKPSRLWNGRQIKNAFQTALALANWEFYESKKGQSLQRPLLKAKHFESVAKTSAHFDDYISDIYGTSEDTWSELAARDQTRQDTHRPMSVGHSLAQDFVPRSKRTFHARRGGGSRDAKADESRMSEGSSDEIKAMELELKIMRMKQAKSTEKEPQVQAGDDENEEW